MPICAKKINRPSTCAPTTANESGAASLNDGTMTQGRSMSVVTSIQPCVQSASWSGVPRSVCWYVAPE